MILLLAGSMQACVEPLYPTQGSDGKLSVKSTVSEATVVTRAESDVDLKEKQLNTLDIFVEHVTNNVGDGSFMKQYHLVASNQEPIKEQANNFLAEFWRKEGLQSGQYYNIYVAANNTKTKGEKDLTTFDVDALKALTVNEVSDGVAFIDTENNIGWGETSTSGNVYKLYNQNPGNARALTNEKEFPMDGIIRNWTPDNTKSDQVFDVTLNRAAAKFVLNVKFDADFLKSLTHNKVGNNWVEKPEAEQVTITESPAWKFYNFAFGAPVFAPDTQGDGIEVHNSGFNIFHNQTYTGEDKHFTITTYSYPNKWNATDYATKAPSLVISVMYSGTTNPHYYRIPLVKSDVTAIERNHIYVINATIATRGSAIQEDVTVTENIQYAVLPWNDVNNSQAIENHVESAQHYFLNVHPTIHTLRGDGNQSTTINYQKASGTSVKWKLYTFNTSTQAKGAAVEPTVSNAVWGWYYDGDGNMKTTYSGMTHMGVTITQTDEGVAKSSGKITVTSTDLPNRAIKYMLLRVYLNESETLYEDVIIRHFPTDNIQSVAGLWSSKTTNNWWNAPTNNNWWTNTNVGGQGIGYDNSLFSAKYYYSRGGYIRSATNINNSTNHGWQNTSLTNRFKYVIQISSSSDEYVLGRPVTTNNQSQDHVVSPAFMIASQLGATQSKHPLRPGNNNDENSYYQRGIEAANFCGSYKEVDEDGTVWTGWRLPTREEVGVILRYQNANYDTMDPVMTGSYYWTLEGAAVATGMNERYDIWDANWSTMYSQTSNDYVNRANDDQYYSYSARGWLYEHNTYIRCIRDMSATQIEKLNGFDAIIQQYQAKTQ